MIPVVVSIFTPGPLIIAVIIHWIIKYRHQRRCPVLVDDVELVEMEKPPAPAEFLDANRDEHDGSRAALLVKNNGEESFVNFAAASAGGGGGGGENFNGQENHVGKVA